MNKVILIGNLVADPEMRYTQESKIPCCNFRIAVQRKHPNQQGVREADFFNCVAWRQTGELIGKSFHKGSKIALVGSLQSRSYEADGQKRYVTEVVLDEFYFVTPRDNNTGTNTEASAPSAASGFTPAGDDEPLPF